MGSDVFEKLNRLFGEQMRESRESLMPYKTDGGGIAFANGECKLLVNASSWITRLGWYLKQGRRMRILTYTLPGIDALLRLFADARSQVSLVANARHIERARELKALCPNLDVAVHPELHAKVVLVEPNTVIVGSSNMGDSGWIEADVGIRSKEVHDETVRRLWETTWSKALIIPEQPPRPRPVCVRTPQQEARDARLRHGGGRLP